MKPRKSSVRQISTVMILGLMVLAPMAAQAAITTPPTGDLTAKWWQWAVSIPATSNPILSDSTSDPTGSLCGVNQAGIVWFLGGTIGGKVTRNCNIPFGKAILFPVINAEWSVAEANANEGNCPYSTNVISGSSKAALQACAKAAMDTVTTTQASIDGVSIQDLYNNYRVQSPLFNFNAVQDNIFAIPSGSTKAVSDGWWVLLSPLSKGQHTIVFYGNAPSLSFDTGVTYNILIT
jgi:hypothetical protein